MKSLAFARTKLNSFSIVGSLAYGLFCASFPTPEVVAVIGRVAYFLSAALFYFLMYVFYCENKESIARLWDNKLRNLSIFVLILIITPVISASLYMVVNHVPYAVAAEKVATGVSNFFYYMPFLP